MKLLHKFLAMVMVLAMIFSFSVTAFAAPVDEATIDTSRTGSLDIYKYDLSSAKKDGIWDSSYVSTGVRDEDGVESLLGDPDRVSPLNENGDAYGYAVKGVQFTYLKVADIRTYSELEDNASHAEVLYGIPANSANDAFLSALGLSSESRYQPADDDTHGDLIYYYEADVLINGLEAALEANSTTVKNALETFVRSNGGTPMPLTDEYGHTSAKDLPLGLYLVVETEVPEMVTDTTAPFLISLPMTSVDGTNATDGGTHWIYNAVLYPKNLTGIPTLEKTLREDKADTGKNDGSDAVTDGYAHTGTASAGDVIDYQIVSTLPSITSAATYLSEYSFVDTLSKGLSYNKGDVVLEFFKDAACTDKIVSWAEQDGKFTVNYNALEDGGTSMTIAMTSEGLKEINESQTVYSNTVNVGYSDCTLRITYKATVHSDASVTYGDAGNPNDVVLSWRRSSSEYYDTLVDDAHIYTFGIDVLKQFRDGKGDFSKVEFILHNDTDNYFVTAELNSDEGVWYVTGHTDQEDQATHFKPTKDGKLTIKGVEDDTYTMTEVQTDSSYTLLKHAIKIVISTAEKEGLCDVYSGDVLGLLQNDPRYADVEPGLFNNVPQKHLEHHPLTASGTVDGKQAKLTADGESTNAYVPFTVVNSRGFDLPQTGSYGNWMFPVIGIAGLSLALGGIWLLLKKRPSESSGK